MARLKKTIAENLQKQLSKHVYKTFGKPLTHSFECESLCESIKSNTKRDIGCNTVRRFLGFLQTEFSPSIKTLDILSEYAGFEDWYSFTQQVSYAEYEPLSLDTEAQLYLKFYKINMQAEGDMNYHNACRNIALRILFNEALLVKLAPLLAKLSVSQVYFFERFPFIDGLGGAYKKSIQLYLQKKTDEAQIFGNNLLFLSAFLCENHKQINTYHTRLNELPINESMHPFLIARSIGSNILYANYKQTDVSFWIAEAHKWNKYFLQKKYMNFWKYPYYTHMICDYLNLAGYFQDSYQIIKTSDRNNEKFEIEEGYVEGLEVVSQIAKHPFFSSDQYLNWISANDLFSNIHPLFKKYYELQALKIKSSLLSKGKKREKVELRISELVQQTGFVYFNK